MRSRLLCALTIALTFSLPQAFAEEIPSLGLSLGEEVLPASAVTQPPPPEPVGDWRSEMAALEARLDAKIRMIENSQQPVYYGNSSPFAFLAPAEEPGVFGSVDYLYWAVRAPGVEYGISDIGGVQDRGAVGQVLRIGENYDTGYRVRLGWRMGNEGDKSAPELVFSYTDFDSELTDRRAGPLRATFISSDNSENDDSDNINTLGVETITPDDRATSAVAFMRFGFETLDLELAHWFKLNDSLAFRVSGGGRAAMIDQFFRVTYTGGDFQTAFTPFREMNYRGGGISLGAQLRWSVINRVHFTTGMRGSVMMGQVETRTFIPDDEPGVPTDVRNRVKRVSPTVEMFAAVSAVQPIGRFKIRVMAGYEFQHWFNLSEQRDFGDSHMEGKNVHLLQDLSLDGFFARVGVDY